MEKGIFLTIPGGGGEHYLLPEPKTEFPPYGNL
jgi:hypothetical protein